MATEFNRPTIPELISRIQSDIESAVTGVTARLRRRFERAVSVALAHVSHGLHGHLSWVADQIFPDTAVERYLLRWCSLFGVDRKVAQRASGGILVSGSGGTMLAGRQWVRPLDGRLYETTEDSDGAITTEVTIAVRAVEGGEDGDADAGTELQLVSPLAGVNGTADVAAGGLTGGTDLESLPLLLERLIERIQSPVMGGAPGDHVTWAEEVPGVTRAWEYEGVDGQGNPGPGLVAVTFVKDEADDIIPTVDDVDEVQFYIDDRSPKQVEVFAPTAVPLVLEITLVPDTAAVRTAVLAEIRDLLAREAEPGTRLPLDHIDEAISAAVGEIEHDLVSPVADVQPGFGELLVYDQGSIDFDP